MACSDVGNNMMFTCGKCNKSIHYGCTKLPPYMLHQLIKKEEKVNCLCENITKYLLLVLTFYRLQLLSAEHGWCLAVFQNLSSSGA